MEAWGGMFQTLTRTLSRGNRYSPKHDAEMDTITEEGRDEGMESSLWEAVEKKKYELCKKLINSGQDVNVKNGHKSSLLHLVARKYPNQIINSIPILKLLIQNGAEINAKDIYGDTPLHIAAMEGLDNMCSILVRNSERDEVCTVEIDARNSDNKTPLHCAAEGGYSKFVELLMQEGADSTLKDLNNYLPLHYAAKKGSSEICKLLTPPLTSNWFDVNDETDSPIVLAAKGGHHHCMREMIRLKDQTNLNYRDGSGNAALHVAAQNGFLKTVKMLLEMEAEVDIQNDGGNTPLMLAVKKNKLDCMSALMEAGADIAKKNKNQRTVLCIAAHENTFECLKELLKEDEVRNLVNEGDSDNKTPLSIALNRKNDNCALLLLSIPNIDVSNLVESLHIAVIKKNQELLRNLIYKGVHTDEKNTASKTPLHIAAEIGNKEACHLLLVKGANINAQTGNGKTALHISSEKGYSSVVLLLIKRGAKFNIKDDKHKLPLCTAAEKGILECCRILISKFSHLSDMREYKKCAIKCALKHKGNNDVIQYLLDALSFKDNTMTQDLKKDLHFYTHKALKEKNKEFLQIIINSDWWEAGFGPERELSCVKTKVGGSIMRKGTRMNGTMDRVTDGAKAGTKDRVTHGAKDETNDRVTGGAKLGTMNRVTHGAKDRTKDRVTGGAKAGTMNRVTDRAKAGTMDTVKDGERDRACSAFRDLIKLFPTLAKSVMDKFVKKPAKSQNGIEYDFRILEDNYYITNDKLYSEKSPYKLDPDAQEVTKDEIKWKTNHPVYLMVKYKRLALLQHSLVDAWLRHKWNNYAKWVFFALLSLQIFSLIVLSLFIVYVRSWKQIKTVCNTTEEVVCQLYKDGKLKDANTTTITTMTTTTIATNTTINNCMTWLYNSITYICVFHSLVFVSFILQLVVETNNFYRLHCEYLGKTWIFIRLPCMLCTTFAIIPSSLCELRLGINADWSWQCGVVALVLAGFLLIHIINQHPSFSIMAVISWDFVRQFLKGIIIVTIMICTFAFVFHKVMGSQEGFNDQWQAFMKTLMWLFGEYEYNTSFLDNKPDFPRLANGLFLVFICTVGASLIQLLKTPSSDEMKLKFIRAARRVNLLLNIDVCLPWSSIRRKYVVAKLEENVQSLEFGDFIYRYTKFIGKPQEKEGTQRKVDFTDEMHNNFENVQFILKEHTQKMNKMLGQIVDNIHKVNEQQLEIKHKLAEQAPLIKTLNMQVMELEKKVDVK